MEVKSKIPGNIDEYIAGFPEQTQRMLQEIRETIIKIVPEVEETIKYAMPAFVYKGNLVFFAGYKNHIGFYPAPTGNAAFKKYLAPYKTGKGTVQFPLDKPVPLDLVERIVKFRLKANLEKEKAKKKIHR